MKTIKELEKEIKELNKKGFGEKQHQQINVG